MQSAERLIQLLPHLRELQLNITNVVGSKSINAKIIQNCLVNAHQLQKLKLTNMNLTDQGAVDNICKIIY